MNDSAERLVAAGRPAEALELLQRQVRGRAGDAKLRIFLFQLLCVLGQWQRALAQLQVCGELDAGALAMVATYRDALQCEAVRESVFAGQATPIVFCRPEPWVALLVRALADDAAGDHASAAALRQRAFDEAPPTPGRLDGVPFDWIADADSRLGPVLEAVLDGRYCWVPFAALKRVRFEPPADLRDLVWAPAQLTFANGCESVALVPVRYAGGEVTDAALQLARGTEWVELAPEQYRGVGQRVLATSAAETGLLEVRELMLDNAPSASAA